MNFIEREQPVTYGTILKEGHFERNSLKTRLDELEQDGKIVKIYSCYCSASFVRLGDSSFKLWEKSELCLRRAGEFEKIMQLKEDLRGKQPLRFSLAEKKTPVFKLTHNHVFRSRGEKFTDEITKCKCGVINYKGKILYPKPLNEEQRIKILSEKQNALIEDIYENIITFFHHFRLYPRIESPRFKKFKGDYTGKSRINENFEYKSGCGRTNNPLGINPDFLKSDGSIDFSKIEMTYRNKRELGSWYMKCSSCGNEEKEYVAYAMSDAIRNCIRRLWHHKCSSCGKVTHIDILGDLHRMFERLENNTTPEFYGKITTKRKAISFKNKRRMT